MVKIGFRYRAGCLLFRFILLKRVFRHLNYFEIKLRCKCCKMFWATTRNQRMEDMWWKIMSSARIDDGVPTVVHYSKKKGKPGGRRLREYNDT